jgi:hypothetical protein
VLEIAHGLDGTLAAGVPAGQNGPWRSDRAEHRHHRPHEHGGPHPLLGQGRAPGGQGAPGDGEVGQETHGLQGGHEEKGGQDQLDGGHLSAGEGQKATVMATGRITTARMARLWKSGDCHSSISCLMVELKVTPRALS